MPIFQQFLQIFSKYLKHFSKILLKQSGMKRAGSEKRTYSILHNTRY